MRTIDAGGKAGCRYIEVYPPVCAQVVVLQEGNCDRAVVVEDGAVFGRNVEVAATFSANRVSSQQIVVVVCVEDVLEGFYVVFNDESGHHYLGNAGVCH